MSTTCKYVTDYEGEGHNRTVFSTMEIEARKPNKSQPQYRIPSRDKMMRHQSLTVVSPRSGAETNLKNQDQTSNQFRQVQETHKVRLKEQNTWTFNSQMYQQKFENGRSSTHPKSAPPESMDQTSEQKNMLVRALSLVPLPCTLRRGTFCEARAHYRQAILARTPRILHGILYNGLLVLYKMPHYTEKLLQCPANGCNACPTPKAERTISGVGKSQANREF